MENLDANGNPIVPTDDKGGAKPTDPNTPGAGGADDKGGGAGDPPAGGSNDDKGSTVPSFRLKEEADARRAAEAKLKEYQDKETAEAEKRKKDAGKHEEIIADRDKKLAEAQTKLDLIPKYEEKIQAMVDNTIAGIKTAIGEEKLNKILSIVGYEALDVMGKADSLAKITSLVGELTPQKPDPKGGAGINQNGKTPPQGGGGTTFDNAVSALFGGSK